MRRPRAHLRPGASPLVAALLGALLGGCGATSPRASSATRSEANVPEGTLAQTREPGALTGEPEAGSNGERMAWWRDARFGLFLHWGLYAVPAGRWNGETGHGEWILTTARIPLARYEQFRDEFHPSKFDARAWARLAKEAGMGYVVITTKHHDGFCLFDSRETDYDVMSTPFRRDVMRELADACRAEGLRIGWYHSIMDWHHPDYLPRREWEPRASEPASFPRYVEHLRAQVRELLTNYGPIGVMWFDGEWEPTWTHAYGKELYALCRELQPDVIVNNRVDVSRGGMSGFSSGEDAVGDFGTPEQEIPATGVPGVDWETCMTMNDHWGYNAADANWKSSRELVRMLVDIASKGGNFLLNIGPTADGELPPPSVERLRDIGRWMRVNGEAIHGTSASPWSALAWGRCTQKRRGDGTTLYLHVFDWPADGRLVVPGLANDVRSARLLAEPGRELACARSEDAVVLALPASCPDPVCTVVALDVAGAPRVVEPPRIRAPSSVLVRELEVRLEGVADGLEVRYSLDGSTPSDASPRYAAPLRLAATTTVKARAFERGRPVSATSEALFTRVEPRPAADASGATPGLARETFAGRWERMPDFAALRPSASRVVETVALDAGPPVEDVGERFNGFVSVPDDDVYTFALASDDGSRVYVDGELVVDDDGLHVREEKRGSIALAAGAHALRVEYFNRSGQAALELSLARAGDSPRPIPASAYSHRP